jgi:hypothetical protein
MLSTSQNYCEKRTNTKKILNKKFCNYELRFIGRMNVYKKTLAMCVAEVKKKTLKFFFCDMIVQKHKRMPKQKTIFFCSVMNEASASDRTIIEDIRLWA